MCSRKTHSRLKGGEIVKSNMIHAVVSERILFDKSILQGPPPIGDLLIKDTASVVKHCALPSKQASQDFLRAKWQKYFSAAENAGDPMVLLQRPPACSDRHKTGRTICMSLPILTDRSIASKVDVTAALTSLNDQFPGKRKMMVVDYQTFAVSWWIKMRQQPLFDDILPVGDELHRQFHTDDCTYRIWYDYMSSSLQRCG